MDDLSRPVFGIFGIPIDAVNISDALSQIRTAAAGRKPFLLSTPNTNFLVHSRRDVEFRRSLLESDLCLADGAPIAWLTRRRGARALSRVAGSDVLEALKRTRGGSPLSVFLFGGAEEAAKAACRSLNAASGGLTCVGTLNPGFGSVEAMSSDATISQINESGADFLIVALGAAKGQAWLARNARHLKIPVRSHLGAAINFEAGRIRRAPEAFQRLGLEWVWRIKEEPQLWRRYWHDGVDLLRVVLTQLIPLMAFEALVRSRVSDAFQASYVSVGGFAVISLSGAATYRNVTKAEHVFRGALSTGHPIKLDLSKATYIDSRFLGLLLMLRKQARVDAPLHLSNVGRRARALIQLNGFGYLLQ